MLQKSTLAGTLTKIPGTTSKEINMAIDNISQISNTTVKAAVKNMATKADIKAALKNMATKDDIKDMATKADIKEAIKDMASKADLKEAVKDMATKTDIENAIKDMEIRLMRFMISVIVAVLAISYSAMAMTLYLLLP